MINWSFVDLMSECADNLDIAKDVQITSMTLDSREVKPGCLFVALKGTQQHGLTYLASAIENGAAAIVWESDTDLDVASLKLSDLTIPCVEMSELSITLGQIADRFYGSPSQQLKVIGVTGTDGKTTVTHYIAQVLNTLGHKAGIIGTIGLGQPGQLQTASLTTPDVISVHRVLRDMLDDGYKTVAMEVSSHALDQGRVNNVAFDIVALTNLTRDHLDYHGTVEAYQQAKAKLFEWSNVSAVLNSDDDFGQALINTLSEQNKPLIDYGVSDSTSAGSTNKLTAHNADFSAQGITARISYANQVFDVTAPVLGDFNLYNVLAAWGCLVELGIAPDEITSAMASLQSVPGRMEKVSGVDDVLVVVDYAHTPGALESALKAIKKHTSNRIVCVFGCGGDRDKGKRPLMGGAAEKYAQLVVLTDDNPRTESPFMIMNDIITGIERPEWVAVEHDRARAIRYAIDKVEGGDAVLIAGKGHETYQIVGEEKRDFDDRVQARQALSEVVA